MFPEELLQVAVAEEEEEREGSLPPRCSLMPIQRMSMVADNSAFLAIAEEFNMEVEGGMDVMGECNGCGEGLPEGAKSNYQLDGLECWRCKTCTKKHNIQVLVTAA
jgi:hypothetical protein